MRATRKHLQRLAVAALLAAPLLLSPFPATAQGGADAPPPTWTAERLIEALDVPPESDIPPLKTRGLIPGEGTEPAAAAASPGVVHDLRILFDFDSAELRPDAERTLDELAAALDSPQLRDHRFRIAGYTDAVGNEDYNLDLSRRRAEAVVDYLTRRHGIPRERLIGEGYGKARLFDPNNPSSGVNRRVEVVNLAAEGG